MRPRPAHQTPSVPVRVLEATFLVLPIVALVPNFFIIPDLNSSGLSTQEFVCALAATALAAIAVAALLLAPERVQIARFELCILGPLLLFLVWQAVSLTWTPDKSEGIRILTIWSGFVVFLGIGVVIAGRRAAMLIQFSLAGVVLVLACSQFYEYSQYGEEMFGVFFSHGITSELLALLLPLQVFTFLSSKERWPMATLALVTAGVGTAALILTFRRGPVLGLFIALCFIAVAVILRWIDYDRKRMIAVVAILLLLGGSFGYLKRQQIVARLRGAVHLQRATAPQASELGLTSRLAIWAVGLETAKHNLFVGTGNGGFQSTYGPERKYVVDNPAYRSVMAAAPAEDFDEVRSPMAHSEYLQVVAELGVVGLALFSIFWAVVVWLLWRQLRNSVEGRSIVLGALGGLIAFGISSAVSGFSFRNTPGPLLLSCLITAGFAATREVAGNPALGKGKKRSHEKRSSATGNVAELTGGLGVRKRAAVAALSVVVALCGLAALRASKVLGSQEAQSQADFRFSKDSPVFNESLVERYQRALDLDPWNAGAHLGYGLLLYQMKRIDESIPHVEFANSHGYSRPLAYLLLAFDYEQANRLKDASQILARCLESFPQSIVTRAAYMALLQKQGNDGLAAEQRKVLESSDRQTGRSWELALQMKDSVATNEAARLGLIPPGQLSPMIARALVQARAYHYLN